MKNILAIAAWLSKLTWIRGDYILHFVVCFLSSFTSYEGAWAAFGASIAAEYKDSVTPGNKWSWWDLFADGLGIAAGVAANMIIKEIIK